MRFEECCQLLYEGNEKKVLHSLDGVLIYLDGLVIIEKTREEHDNCLKAVLERIRKHGLSWNSSKSKFSETEVSHLVKRSNSSRSINDTTH
jgi:hypothetical protein